MLDIEEAKKILDRIELVVNGAEHVISVMFSSQGCEAHIQLDKFRELFRGDYVETYYCGEATHLYKKFGDVTYTSVSFCSPKKQTVILD